jgi:single-stranded-DNA-specific exonuclease
MDPDLVARFGGHAMAAGLTIAHSALERFTEVFELAAQETTDAGLYARSIVVDGPLKASEITHSLIEAMDKIVWGQGFAEPVFANEFEVLEQRILKGSHLKLTLALEGRKWSAIWFRRVQALPDRVRLAYRPTIDEYRGERRILLMIEQLALD